MKRINAQRGFTFWSLSFILFCIGFVAFNVLKLLPVYLDSFAIESAVHSLGADKGETYNGAMSVKTALSRRLSMNNISILTLDDIAVVRENNLYMVDVEYEVRLPYIKNIDLILSFKHHADVLAD